MIKFAHLSDTHILKDYSKSNMKELFEKVGEGVENLSKLLQKLDKEGLDFITISGDIVHEGEKKDYEYLKEIIENNLQNTEIIMSLGNHDRKEPFREVFLGEASKESYYFAKDIKGLRVIVLDSSLAGRETGEISKEQINWLKEVLSSPSKEGSIIILHHPITWENEGFAMKVEEEFKEILKESDVLGIFCGHTHYNNVYDFEGIPQITAESMAFGIEFGKDYVQFNDEVGYNTCLVDNRKLSIHSSVVCKDTKELGKIPLEVLQKMM